MLDKIAKRARMLFVNFKTKKGAVAYYVQQPLTMAKAYLLLIR